VVIVVVPLPISRLFIVTVWCPPLLPSPTETYRSALQSLEICVPHQHIHRYTHEKFASYAGLPSMIAEGAVCVCVRPRGTEGRNAQVCNGHIPSPPASPLPPPSHSLRLRYHGYHAQAALRQERKGGGNGTRSLHVWVSPSSCDFLCCCFVVLILSTSRFINGVLFCLFVKYSQV
jgi:hypothetical protein